LSGTIVPPFTPPVWDDDVVEVAVVVAVGARSVAWAVVGCAVDVADAENDGTGVTVAVLPMKPIARYSMITISIITTRTPT
jgi:hypothetical protein